MANQEYTLTVTAQDLSLIDQAIGALPYRSVAALVQKLNLQIQQQEAAKQVKPDNVVDLPKAVAQD